MIVFGALTVLCLIHPFVNGFHGISFRGVEQPESIKYDDTNKIVEGWITQQLDHFNHLENRTWSMRYYENSAYLKENGPIFIMIGGEWEISIGFLQSGLMYDIASTSGGIMYYTEHRYYGKSKPTKDSSVKNLQYLNVDQALADLAYFIETKKRERNLKDSPVIVFGGSYAGNVAAWARLKYPHLIQGALASSAPIFAKADFYEYYEVVAKSLDRHDSKCVAEIKAAFESVEEILHSEDGPRRLKVYFNLCDTPDIESPTDVAFFINTLTEIFAGAVQYDKLEDGQTKIGALCNEMTAENSSTPLQRLARLVSNADECLDVNYNNFIKKYREVSWAAANGDIMRIWYHQTCTEFGYYQTTNSSKSIFGTLVPVNLFIDMCTDLYGEHYNKELLDSRIRRTNIMNGGLRPDLTKVIFTNGDIDPWHAISVLEDLNTLSPAILINGSSHCLDLQSDRVTDVADLKKARAKIQKIIGKWLI